MPEEQTATQNQPVNSTEQAIEKFITELNEQQKAEQEQAVLEQKEAEKQAVLDLEKQEQEQQQEQKQYEEQMKALTEINKGIQTMNATIEETGEVPSETQELITAVRDVQADMQKFKSQSYEASWILFFAVIACFAFKAFLDQSMRW